MNSFLKIWVVAEASRRFVEDRQNNALELILSTPLQASAIVQGQWRALVKLFALPVLVATAWELFLLNNVYYRRQGDDRMTMLTALFLPFDCVALAWLGMWLALKYKGRVRVMLTGLIIVLAIPLLADVFSKQIADAIFPGTGLAGAGLEDTRVTAIHALTFVFDLMIFAWAATKLMRGFAAQAKGVRATAA